MSDDDDEGDDSGGTTASVVSSSDDVVSSSEFGDDGRIHFDDSVPSGGPFSVFAPSSHYQLARSILKAEKKNLMVSNVQSILRDSELVKFVVNQFSKNQFSQNPFSQNPFSKNQFSQNFPVVANVRCGEWYVQSPDNRCCFKSTDGHSFTNNFSSGRLNLHLLRVLERHGGVIVVDATKQGKKFPDSFQRTIPVWCAIVNAVCSYEKAERILPSFLPDEEEHFCAQSLPSYVSAFRQVVPQSFIDLLSNKYLPFPLRPILVYPNAASLAEAVNLVQNPGKDFLPVICCSASSDNIEDRSFLSGSQFQRGMMTAIKKNDERIEPLEKLFQQNCKQLQQIRSRIDKQLQQVRNQIDKQFNNKQFEFVQGAGDDAEFWSAGLSPRLFWEHSLELRGLLDPHVLQERVKQIVDKKDEVEMKLVMNLLPNEAGPIDCISWGEWVALDGKDDDDDNFFFSLEEAIGKLAEEGEKKSSEKDRKKTDKAHGEKKSCEKKSYEKKSCENREKSCGSAAHHLLLLLEECPEEGLKIWLKVSNVCVERIKCPKANVKKEKSKWSKLLRTVFDKVFGGEEKTNVQILPINCKLNSTTLFIAVFLMLASRRNSQEVLCKNEIRKAVAAISVLRSMDSLMPTLPRFLHQELTRFFNEPIKRSRIPAKVPKSN